MSQEEKIINKILYGKSDGNIYFDDLRKVILWLGFNERIKGDHHIYTKHGVDEIINIQPKGDKSKAYQVKQVRNLILKYRLV